MFDYERIDEYITALNSLGAETIVFKGKYQLGIHPIEGYYLDKFDSIKGHFVPVIQDRNLDKAKEKIKAYIEHFKGFRR